MIQETLHFQVTELMGVLQGLVASAGTDNKEPSSTLAESQKRHDVLLTSWVDEGASPAVCSPSTMLDEVCLSSGSFVWN